MGKDAGKVLVCRKKPFVILSVAKDLLTFQILRFAQNDYRLLSSDYRPLWAFAAGVSIRRRDQLAAGDGAETS